MDLVPSLFFSFVGWLQSVTYRVAKSLKETLGLIGM